MENRKKIGILTHPLTVSYGGILQAYALQRALRGMGYDVRTVALTTTSPRYRQFLKRILLPLWWMIRPGSYPTARRKNMARRVHTERFISDNIRMTVPVRGVFEAKLLEPYGFDAWVVGSDQCWRAAYAPDPRFYFMGFVPEESPARRIAYAVSVGKETWDYNPRQTALCALLASRFDAVSVRESSAIALCREHLGVEAEHVIDPTMLLPAGEYRRLADEEGIAQGSPSVVSYILDRSPETERITGEVSAQTGVPVRHLSVNFNHTDAELREKYPGVYIPVTEWLRLFADARFVVTDSFHGAVFSIIFNKQFLVVGNKYRGMARFTSLLEMFGLEDRLVKPGAIVTHEMLAHPVEYDRVNAILERERAKAVDFLNKHLGKK